MSYWKADPVIIITEKIIGKFRYTANRNENAKKTLGEGYDNRKKYTKILLLNFLGNS